jgi:hypothetical protein
LRSSGLKAAATLAKTRLFIGKWGHGARNGLPCPR